MTDEAVPDSAHFARAVTELGERQNVVSSTAIFNTQGLKIIDKGVTVDAKLYERLTRHQLSQPLAQCVEAESTVNGAELREAAQAAIESEPLFAAMYGDGRTRDMLLEELSQVPLPKPVAFQLTLARETYPELWRQSLRCAMTAAWLVRRQDGSRHDMRMLAAAGLLQDVGMLHIDPVLMQPTIQLDRAQRRQLYAHPLISTTLLERHHEYPRPLLSAVLEHHERLDGSGYPRNIRGDAQGSWGRMLAISGVVTAIFSGDHPAPRMRLSVVLRMNRHAFDATMVTELLQLVAKLPDDQSAPPAENAVQDLTEIDRLLRAWPASDDAATGDARTSAVTRVHDQCGQLLRQLADIGAAGDQLATLAGDLSDAELASEMALILHEATWQLRIVSRQALRRWALTPDEALPGWFDEWLQAIDTLCDRGLGIVAAPPAPASSAPAGAGMPVEPARAAEPAQSESP